MIVSVLLRAQRCIFASTYPAIRVVIFKTDAILPVNGSFLLVIIVYEVVMKFGVQER